MLQPKEVSKKRRVIHGQDPQAGYRELIRAELQRACGDLEIPKMYQPGIVNSTDLALAMFCLGLWERLRELEKKKAPTKKISLGGKRGSNRRKTSATKRKAKTSA